jgi:hypothetical protein
MAATNSGDLQGIIEKRVSEVVTTTLIQESVSLGVVKQFSVSNGMDRLDIPLFNSLAVQAITENTAMTESTIAPTVAQLDLDRQRGVAWGISKRASVQQKIDSVSQAVKNGARELAAEIDDYLFGIMVAGAGSTEGLAVDYTGDALAAIAGQKAIMDLGNVQKFDRFIIASPGFVQELLGNNNVINADKYGSEQPIMAGYVSRVYGFTIVESSSASLPAGGFVACQMEATAFARQINPMLLREEKALAVKDEYSLSHLYGGVLTDTGSARITVVTA